MHYNRIEDSNKLTGAGLRGYATISPAKLVEIFGQPSLADEYKVSGRYLFRNTETNEVFSIYEWQSTNLCYDDQPSLEEFWASNEPYKFHIGGFNGSDYVAFAEAIEALDALDAIEVNALTDNSKKIMLLPA